MDAARHSSSTTSGFTQVIDRSSSWASLIQQAVSRRETRNVTYFTAALAFLMMAELVYGLYTDSIGLTSDAMHMAFHTAAMGITVYGVLVSKQPPTFSFSYGYERYEVLAAFSNALMLVFVCLFILAGALHRLIEPRAFAEGGIPHKATFGVLGLALNGVGVWALAGTPGGTGVGSMGHVQRYAGKQEPGLGVRSAALHAYTDAVSSLAVLASVFAARQGLLSEASADTWQSLVTASFTLYIAVPLFTATGYILLGTRPAGLAHALEQARRETLALAGVLDIMEEHCWTQSPGQTVGSVRVKVASDLPDTAALVRAVGALYSRAGVSDMTVECSASGAAAAAAGAAGMGHSGGAGGHAHSHGHSDHGHSHASHGHSHDHHGHSHG